MEKSEEEIILVTDGGYDGQDNIALAKEKNVRLVTTALIGKEAPKSLCRLSLSGTMPSKDIQKSRFIYHFKKCI